MYPLYFTDLTEEYENKTGIKVTKFGYKYDFEPQQFAIGIKPMQSIVYEISKLITTFYSNVV